MKHIVTSVFVAFLLGGCAVVPLDHHYYGGDGYRGGHYTGYRHHERYRGHGGYYRGHRYPGYGRQPY